MPTNSTPAYSETEFRYARIALHPGIALHKAYVSANVYKTNVTRLSITYVITSLHKTLPYTRR